MKLIVKFIKSLAKIASRSKILYQFSTLVTRYYTNDANADINKNGELNLIQFLAQSDFFLRKIRKKKQHMYFFDVGANIGEYSKILWDYFISKNFETGNAIFSFDPSIDNLNKIKKLRLNNVNLINYAVTNKKGKVIFFESKNRSLSGTDSLFDMGTIGYKPDKQNKKSVKTITLDNFCYKKKINHIKLLKMDIEGAEFQALQGSRSLLKKGAIDIIQFEFGHAARADRILLLDIILLLEKYKYQVYVLKPTAIEKIVYTPFVENRYNMGNFVSFQDRLLPVMKKIIRTGL